MHRARILGLAVFVIWLISANCSIVCNAFAFSQPAQRHSCCPDSQNAQPQKSNSCCSPNLSAQKVERLFTFESLPTQFLPIHFPIALLAYVNQDVNPCMKLRGYPLVPIAPASNALSMIETLDVSANAPPALKS